MGFIFKAGDINSTPKLTLSKLPFCRSRDEPPSHMQTPPLNPSLSIPFQWEEAPGKPRSTGKSRAMPPRLLHEEATFAMTPSPTSVLQGPYVRVGVGRTLSLSCTFSFRAGRRSRPGNLGSGRWGSERKFSRESLGDIFRSEDMSRVGRKRSFLRMSSKYLWGDIYASLKQAIPWKRRQS